MKKLIPIFILAALLVPSMTRADIYGSSLIMWLRMDSNDISGTSVTDRSGNGNTGTTAGSPAVVAGRQGEALSFNGSTQCISSNVNLGSINKVALTFWLKWTAFANNDALAGEYTDNYNNQNGFIMDANSSAAPNGFDFFMSLSSGGYNGETITRPSAGVWHFYAINFDRTTGTAVGTTVWVDGKQQTAAATLNSNMGGNNFTNGDNVLNLMSRNCGSPVLFGAGSMDDVRLYNTLITQSQVVAIYYSTRGEGHSRYY